MTDSPLQIFTLDALQRADAQAAHSGNPVTLKILGEHKVVTVIVEWPDEPAEHTTDVTDDMLSEYRVIELMQGMPRCLRTGAELRAAILKALWLFRVERCLVPRPRTERKQYLGRVVNMLDKGMELLEDTDNNIALLFSGNEEQWVHVTRELPAGLRGAVELAKRAQKELEFDDDDESAMRLLIRRLVAIYEWATGEPAKLPYIDRETYEVRGPLLNFIMIAAEDAFRVQPMRPDGIRHHLRELVGKGALKKKSWAAALFGADAGGLGELVADLGGIRAEGNDLVVTSFGKFTRSWPRSLRGRGPSSSSDQIAVP